MKIKSIFSRESFRAHGLQFRLEQALVAADVERVLNASSPAVQVVPVKRPDGSTDTKGEPHRIARAATGFIEAGTGTGKTLAYLVPAMLHQANMGGRGGRVVISTFTRALQRQIMSGDDVSRAMALTGCSPRIAVRMGRANFIAPSRVFSYAARLEDENKSDPSWDAFVDWVRSWDGRDDVPPLDKTFQAWEEMWGEMPSLNGVMLSQETFRIADHNDDEDPDSEPYRAHAEASRNADIVITNHATMLLNSRNPEHILGPVHACIFDEADRLPDAAASLMTHRLRPSMLLSRMARRADAVVPDALRALSDAIEDVMCGIGELNNFENVTPAQLAREFPKHFTELSELMDRFRPALNAHDAASLDVVRASFDKDAQKSDSHVAYISFSPMRRLPALCVDPVNPTKFVEGLFRAFEPDALPVSRAVFLSATLANFAVKQEMANIHKDFGVAPDTIIVREQREPKRFGRMSFVLPDPRMSPPFEKFDEDGVSGLRYSQDWVQYVVRAMDADKDRRKLVLTPSFAEVEELLKARAPDEKIGKSVLVDGVLFHMPSDPAHTIARRLAQNDTIRAVVTPSMWEGVNLVFDGKLWVEDLLVTRQAIAPMAKPLKERMILMLRHLPHIGSEDRAQMVLHSRSASNALRKLRQGIGRGIRGPEDQVRVWLLDPRLTPDKNWLSRIANAMDETDPTLGDELVNAESLSSHPAMKKWAHAIPERFENALADAAMFLKEGDLAWPPTTPLFV